MNLDRSLLLFAGSMVLISVALTHWHHPNWMWLTVFVGANLIQAAFTRFCPTALLFRKLGIKAGCAFN